MKRNVIESVQTLQKKKRKKKGKKGGKEEGKEKGRGRRRKKGDGREVGKEGEGGRNGEGWEEGTCKYKIKNSAKKKALFKKRRKSLITTSCYIATNKKMKVIKTRAPNKKIKQVRCSQWRQKN